MTTSSASTSASLSSLLSLNLTPKTQLLTYDPISSILQDIINTLKSHESHIGQQNDTIKTLRDENRRDKMKMKQAITGLNAKVKELDEKLRRIEDPSADSSQTDAEQDPNGKQNASQESETDMNDDLSDLNQFSTNDLGSAIDPDEYASLLEKTDDNSDKVKELNNQMDDMNQRMENLVSLVQSVSEVAKNSERMASDADKKAQEANNEASKANEAAGKASDQAEKALSEIEKLSSDLGDKLSAAEKEASEARDAARKAAESSDSNSKSIEEIQSRLDEHDSAIKEAAQNRESSNDTAPEGGANSADIDELKNRISELEKTLEKFRQEQDNSHKKHLLEPEVPVNTPKVRSSQPSSEGDYATKKEVQLLRNILVRFENEMHELYNLLRDLQQQRAQSGEPNSAAGAGTNTATTTTSASNQSNAINRPASSSSTSGAQSARLSTTSARDADSSRPNTSAGVTNSADEDAELRRKNYNMIRRLPSRDIRSQYTTELNDNDAGDNNEQTTQDKVYNTFAITLNEVLGRVDLLESAVAELQSLLEDLQRNGLSSSLDRPVSSHSSAGGASSDDVEKILKKLQEKADKPSLAAISKEMQDVSSLVSKLQRDLENKANSDNAVDMGRFRDLETKIVKKVDRAELQALISKLMSDKNRQHSAAASISPSKSSKNSGASSARTAKYDTKSIVDLEKLKEVISAHAHDINTLFKTKADKGEVFRDLSDYKETLDRLDQVKADANIVARKAEREYVDNVLDKLKKDLESFVNNLNAHTSDLFAKDLEFLRGLLDQKASKGDMKKLKEILRRMSAQDMKKTDGGLAGHRQFRCLSCNRTMESMKSHPTSMNFMNFVSHLPNPKNKLYPRKAFLNDPLSPSTMKGQQMQKGDGYGMEGENGAMEENGNLPPLQK